MRPQPSSQPLPRPHSIDQVLAAFAEEHSARLDRHVLFLLALCINNYGHRNLDLDERARFEKAYHEEGKDFFELFGPDKLLPELQFFCTSYLASDVHTSERVVKRAPSLIEELRRWLVDGGWVSPQLLAEERAREAARLRMRQSLGRLLSALVPSVLALDPGGLAEKDFVAHDHHPVARLSPRRVWLSVFPQGKPVTVGPILISERASKGLRPGWSIASALGRVRGRWRLAELTGVHPRI